MIMSEGRVVDFPIWVKHSFRSAMMPFIRRGIISFSHSRSRAIERGGREAKGKAKQKQKKTKKKDENKRKQT
jgi:hypothetical protein